MSRWLCILFIKQSMQCPLLLENKASNLGMVTFVISHTQFNQVFILLCSEYRKGELKRDTLRNLDGQYLSDNILQLTISTGLTGLLCLVRVSTWLDKHCSSGFQWEGSVVSFTLNTLSTYCMLERQSSFQLCKRWTCYLLPVQCIHLHIDSSLLNLQQTPPGIFY